MRAVAAALAVSAAMTATAAIAAKDLDAVLGRALFEREWIAAPASTDSADGIGPLFGAKSCAGCHTGPTLGARFTRTADGKLAGRGVVLRFGDSGGRPDPVYGHLLQNQAVPGLEPEGRLVLAAGPRDGYGVSVHLNRGPRGPATRMSLRVAPPLAGRAALDDIDAEAVLALADPDDRNGDGISGRARMAHGDGGETLGRYGWKAANPALADQVADAFAQEIGLSSALRRLPHGDCTEREPDCLAAPTGASPRFGGQEISDEMIGLVEAYLRSAAAPDPAPPRGTGAEIFADTGCAACHVPALPKAGGGSVIAYTDLLLHDMGRGLDDGVGEPGAASAEWRTAPLIALDPQKGARRYLHDGRAPTINAAIRAHGGEAEPAGNRYRALGESDRRALIAFLERL
jgi:CxxC motif-containing protein (DUF1111 family)